MTIRRESELYVEQDVLLFTATMCSRNFNDLVGHITGSLWYGYTRRPLTAELACDIIIA
jgi:hypothetical protein